MRLIAEVKRRSPSAGPLSRVLAPADRAVVYARAGAAMVSVLCDGPFFDGAGTTWKRRARRSTRGAARAAAGQGVRPRRPARSQEARDRGADAVLLIARIVDAAHAGRPWWGRRATRGSSPWSRWWTSGSCATRWPRGATSSGSTRAISTRSPWTRREPRACSPPSRPTSSPCTCRGSSRRTTSRRSLSAAPTPPCWARRSCDRTIPAPLLARLVAAAGAGK